MRSTLKESRGFAAVFHAGVGTAVRDILKQDVSALKPYLRTLVSESAVALDKEI